MTRREFTFLVSSNFSAKVFRRTLSASAVKVLLVLVGLLVVVLIAALVLAGSGVYRLARLSYLEFRNNQLETEFAKMSLLRQRLDRLEQENRKMAAMLGVELTPPPIDWSSVPFDSSALPEWAKEGEWGTRPVPVLVPLEGYVVSRGFTETHTAIDLAAQSGTPVRAAADGIVTERGKDSIFGRFVLLNHRQGYETYYGHLENLKAALGDTVRAGQTIGTVGSTGRSSAPHLHFEIRKDSQSIDPAKLIKFQ